MSKDFPIRCAFLVHLLLGQAAAADCDTGECKVGAMQPPEKPYYWPMARGPIGSHSTSPYRGPRDLSSSLKWKWTQQPLDQYVGTTSNGAALIDDKKNIYNVFGPQIRKFSPDGAPMWTFSHPQGVHPFPDNHAFDIPALMDGLLFSTTSGGAVVALSMETGSLVWSAQHPCSWKTTTRTKAHETCKCDTFGTDIGSIAAHKGLITVRTHEPWGGGACRAAVLNASNGEFVWDYAFDNMVWNFSPIIADDGESFLFQDSTGQVYRLGWDGKEIWKSGITHETFLQTWTDGGLQIGENGVVYAMKSIGGHNIGPGLIRAFRLSDGKELWQSEHTPEVPNAWPVIGRMRKGDPLTVIAPTGKAGGHATSFYDFLTKLGSWTQTPVIKPIVETIAVFILNTIPRWGDSSPAIWGTPSQDPWIFGLDAEKGTTLWKTLPFTWKRGHFQGEIQRLLRGQGFCMPNPVGNPTLDADGNLYIGMMDGLVYHFVRDDNGPGVKVQSTYDVQDCFSNGGVTMAPDMMVIVSCQTVLVFRGEP